MNNMSAMATQRIYSYHVEFAERDENKWDRTWHPHVKFTSLAEAVRYTGSAHWGKVWRVVEVVETRSVVVGQALGVLT